MRMLLLALLTATAAGLAGGPPKEGNAIQCQVALEVVKDLTSRDYGKPVVLSTAEPTFLHLQAERLSHGWATSEQNTPVKDDPPPADLAVAFTGSVRNSIPHCHSIKDWLTRQKIPFGNKAVKAVTSRVVNDRYPAGIFTVGLPVVSGDGGVALVYTSDTWGEEAGGGFVRIYRRQDDGTWKSSGILRLWVS